MISELQFSCGPSHLILEICIKINGSALDKQHNQKMAAVWFHNCEVGSARLQLYLGLIFPFVKQPDPYVVIPRNPRGRPSRSDCYGDKCWEFYGNSHMPLFHRISCSISVNAIISAHWQNLCRFGRANASECPSAKHTIPSTVSFMRTWARGGRYSCGLAGRYVCSWCTNGGSLV